MMTHRRSVLLIEQGFLKPRGRKPVHGVELFRLNLIRQLALRQIDVTVVAERTWAARLEQDLLRADLPSPPRIVDAALLLGVAGTGLVGAVRAARLRRREHGAARWDVVLHGNARLGLVPAMHYARWAELAPRHMLFAHRDPGSNFLDAVSTLHFDVVANSEWVASWYRGHVSGRVDVCYGLPNADRFFPRAEPRPDDGLIHFCLLGRLPNISKGQEKAIAALRAVPEPLRSRMRLHLASFAEPPDFRDTCIVAHPWMAPEAVPEFLRGMDVMLTISSHETFSQAIVQGMLTGLPIIASDLPVYVEKIDPDLGGAGGIITTSAQEVTAAMMKLAGDPVLRAQLGAEGRRVARERYMWDTDRFIDRYLFPSQA